MDAQSKLMDAQSKPMDAQSKLMDAQSKLMWEPAMRANGRPHGGLLH